MHLYLMILQIRDKIIFKNHLQCAIVIFILHFYPLFASFCACQISCMIMHFDKYDIYKPILLPSFHKKVYIFYAQKFFAISHPELQSILLTLTRSLKVHKN